MKSTKLLIAFAFITTLSHAQNWVPATPFPAPGGPTSQVNCMITYNSELIIGGSFTSVGGIVAHRIAKWNGISWNPVGIANLIQDPVNDLIIYNAELYILTQNVLYKLNGNNLEIVFGTLYTPLNGGGRDLHVFQNKLYCIQEGIIKIYDGATWTEIITPFGAEHNNVLQDYNNELYLGTCNPSGGGIGGVYKYFNSNWLDIKGVVSQTVQVFDLEVFNNELYAVGSFNSIGGLATNNVHLAKYNGTTWSLVPHPIITLYTTPVISFDPPTAHLLSSMNNKLYVAGTFGITGFDIATRPLMSWDGLTWGELSLNGAITGMCSIFFNGELYLGGNMSVLVPSDFTYYYDFLKLSTTVAVEELVPNNFTLSPNPTNSKISVKSNAEMIGKEFMIYDQLGKEVKSGVITSEETEIDLSNLTEGVYLFKAGADMTESFKIIKQ